LLAALDDRNCILRTAAARELHVRGGRHVFEKMRVLSAAPRYESREISAFVLGQLGTPSCPFAVESIPILLTLLDDPYSEVRSAAVVAFASLAMLGRTMPADVVQRIALSANDNEAEVRATIANTIEIIDRTIAEAVLTSLMVDLDPDVRSAASISLADIGADDMRRPSAMPMHGR
jgi:HEAT repeat protein